MDHARFAKAFENPAGSPIRELFPYLGLPGMISLAGGYPSPALFDMEGLKEAAAWAVSAPAHFQYGPTEGQQPLREQLALLCARRGITTDAARIMVTTGSQQAFDLLVRTLIDPGDTVLVESPAYPATLQALRLASANIVEVTTDDDGLDIDALRQALSDLPAGRTPKLLYTVPNFSNPGGTVLATPRRRQLIELARQHGFLIVEDDPYGDLRFTDERFPTLWQLGSEGGDDNPVLYLSSLSKTVAPALRTGWLIGPEALLRRCAIAKQTADLCSSPITQLMACAYLRLDRYDGHVATASQAYRARMRSMVDALRSRLGEQASFVEPKGGLFLWLRLADDIDTGALFQAAVDQKVLYVPGKAFYAHRPDPQCLRLSFAAPTEDEAAIGIARLQAAIDQIRSA